MENSPTVIKQILYIINNIDVRHWERITYTSLRNVGVYTWEETVYGEYLIYLLENHTGTDNDRILFSELYINIHDNHIYISFVITDQITKEEKSKKFYNSADFINYYNHITKNNGDI